MYCPRCGTPLTDEDMLFGGCCGWRCSRCSKAVDCYDVFTKEYEESSKPLRNMIKAALLRRSYDIRGK